LRNIEGKKDLLQVGLLLGRESGPSIILAVVHFLGGKEAGKVIFGHGLD
jgi:hypothetical protein